MKQPRKKLVALHVMLVVAGPSRPRRRSGVRVEERPARPKPARVRS